MRARDYRSEAPHRILVYGVTGSGKSTLARELARLHNVPLVLADELAWRPGWIKLPPTEQRELFSELAAGDQ